MAHVLGAIEGFVHWHMIVLVVLLAIFFFFSFIGFVDILSEPYVALWNKQKISKEQEKSKFS